MCVKFIVIGIACIIDIACVKKFSRHAWPSPSLLALLALLTLLALKFSSLETFNSASVTLSLSLDLKLVNSLLMAAARNVLANQHNAQAAKSPSNAEAECRLMRLKKTLIQRLGEFLFWEPCATQQIEFEM